ncbi:MAG: AAA family ATPase [Verrucomicrobia bacterium]|jgi:energy-coupling factor transporter ATP-binding protein EcfA2|nr:AAA family ATPase [Verrucomicrobiota bacterium]
MSDAFESLDAVAAHVRETLEEKKCILLYAHNGTGKTRLSTTFKDIGKHGEERDTLYFNAFTEDLFSWENDLDNDSERYLKLNTNSSFFDGLESMEMDNRIREKLSPFCDFDFRIDTDNWEVHFSREVFDGGERTQLEDIKISRGEENCFIWCFFLAIAQLAIDGAEAYAWVKYIYIDDPISSLDEQNAITVSSNLANLIKDTDNGTKFVVSTHHNLFFNVLFNELGRAVKTCLSLDRSDMTYRLRRTGEDAVFGHIHELIELKNAVDRDELCGHHFSRLRSLLERAAVFHGHTRFEVCLKQPQGEHGEAIYRRLIQILSHGNYSLYAPRRLEPENKQHFSRILSDFIEFYPFNREIFESPVPTFSA